MNDMIWWYIYVGICVCIQPRLVHLCQIIPIKRWVRYIERCVRMDVVFFQLKHLIYATTTVSTHRTAHTFMTGIR